MKARQKAPGARVGHQKGKLSLNSDNANYLRRRAIIAAVEALARIRRLSRTGPLLQVNIAQDGGQQVNVQKPEKAG